MVKFLSKSFLLDALVFLQFLGNSSSAPCSDNSWIQLPATSVYQQQSVTDASNATDCQNKCLGNSSCVGVVWNSDNSRCYFNLDPSNIGINYVSQPATTYYGLVRNYSACDKDNYNCSWIGDRDNHGFQGSEVDRHDLIGCVQACQDNASCAAVDWNYQESSCWIFSDNPYTGSLPGIFHFMRNCTGSPRSPGIGATVMVGSKIYTPRISTVGPFTTTSTSTSTSAPVAPLSPAGPSSVASSSVSTSTTAASLSSSSVSSSSLGAPSSTSSTTAAALSSTSTGTSATSASTTITSSTATISTPSAAAPEIPALALEVSQANDWYPLAIKPAYIVLAGVGGGCILLVITAVVILCEYPLNRTFYASSGSSSSAAASKHVHAYQSQSPETHYSSEAREENVDMDEVEVELDKRPQDGDAEDSQ